MRCDPDTSVLNDSMNVVVPIGNVPLVNLSSSGLNTRGLLNSRMLGTWTGKAPPIDTFTEEEVNVLWED